MKALTVSAITRENIKIFTLLLISGAVGLGLFMRCFTLGLPSAQFSGCLSYDVFLVSKIDSSVKRGGIYAVTLDRPLLGKISAGAKLIKIVAAVGGDTVRIESDGVWVNETTFYPVPLDVVARHRHMNPAQLKKTFTVPLGELFLLGNTPISYDSRFWGTINEKNVIGRAFVLF